MSLSIPTVRITPLLRPFLHTPKPTLYQFPTSSSSSSSSSPRRPRTYHSYDRPSPSSTPFPPTETLILRASTPHIPHHGFTLSTLSLGAQDAGYTSAACINLFPRGAFSLAHYHLFAQRERLKGCRELVVERTDMDGGVNEGEDGGLRKGTVGRVKALTWERLMGNREVVGRLQEALTLLTLPANLPTSLHELHLLSDEIQHLAGSTTVDATWYTQRLTLSTIYAAAELYMTTDTSAGFSDTREFLERAFEDSRRLGDVWRGVGEWGGFTLRAGVNCLRSRGVRI